MMRKLIEEQLAHTLDTILNAVPENKDRPKLMLIDKFDIESLESSSIKFIWGSNSNVGGINTRNHTGCKGRCIHYKAKSLGRHVNHQKRYQVCDIYLRWRGFYRPCCGD
jgi:hypothetical protein